MKGIYLFRLIFKDIYRYLKDPQGRRFLVLSFKIGDIEGLKPKSVRIFDKLFQTPHPFSFLWQFHDIFFQRGYLFDTTKSNPVIIDCGSNVGLSVLFFKKSFPDSVIHAFEADPKVFEYLKNNISEHFKDVNLINKAVWISDDELSFHSNGSDSGSLDIQGEVKVQGCDLNTYLDQFESIEMLKMDIEGAEIQVLPHIQNHLGKIENVFVEYHSSAKNHQRLSQILNLLEDSGFRYHIKHEYDRKEPLKFIKSDIGEGFDMQLGIFASRKNIADNN